MSSFILRQPRHIFSGLRPPPPLWPQCTESMSQPALVAPLPSLQWMSLQEDGKLSLYLCELQRGLRSVHKRKILWSTKESVKLNLPPNNYLDLLLGPLAEVFNQLRGPRIDPLKYNAFKLDENIYGAVFSSEYLTWHDRTGSVMVLALPNDLFAPEGNVSPSVASVLSRALEYDPIAPSAIIVTNFGDIAVFFPPSVHNPLPSFERVSSTQFSLALQVVSAACIHGTLRGPYWICYPDPGYEFLLPEGPAQNPDGPMLSDDDVFATYHRHSDFDLPTLLRDKARALQFIRWHDHIRRRYSKLVAKPNDVLQVVPNTLHSILLRPLYPFDIPELQPDTIKHIKETQRTSPLQAAGILERFMCHKSFVVEIQDIVSTGSEHGICTVYRCKITSIDNWPVTSSPNLCLKLFDDRFYKFEENIEEEVDKTNEEDLYWWLHPYVMTETLMSNEILAYNKLQAVQGSIIPWFYGAHQFTLPDGTVLHGLLMEYIEGQDVNTNIEPPLSQERQIKMIESCRHAARILDVGDISQHDWHSGQILLYSNPVTQVDHAVLVDFGFTTQTYEEGKLNYIGNYGDMLKVLLYQNSTLDLGLVWKYFGEPDDWDPIDRKEGGRLLKAPDMFSFISIS